MSDACALQHFIDDLFHFGFTASQGLRAKGNLCRYGWSEHLAIWLLEYITDKLTTFRWRHRCNICAVIVHTAFASLFKAYEQTSNSRFATTITTTDGNIFSAFDGESHITEDVYRWHIAKTDVFNLKHERHRPFLVHHQRVELVVYFLLYLFD